MTAGYLDIRAAATFLGGRSVSWLRSHLHEIPHWTLYDRHLFDPAELKAFVEQKAERRSVVDLDAVVRNVMGNRRRKGATR